MSGGKACDCGEAAKPVEERAWLVSQRHCNHSAFNGGRRTWSAWSAVHCLECRAYWRTRAHYVGALADGRYNRETGLLERVPT